MMAQQRQLLFGSAAESDMLQSMKMADGLLTGLQKKAQGTQDSVAKIMDMGDWEKALKGAVGAFGTMASRLSAIYSQSQKIKKTTTTVTKEIRRAVADFDRLNKLSGGKTTTQTTVESTAQEGELTALQQAAQQVSVILQAAVTAFSVTVAAALASFAGWNGGPIAAGLLGICTAVAAVQALIGGDRTLAIWLGAIAQALSSSQGAVDTVGHKLSGVLLPALTGAVTAWVALGSAVLAFSLATGTLTGPLGLVVAGITAVIGVIALLIRNWDGVAGTAQRVWAAIRGIWGGVAGWFISTLVNPLGNAFKGMVNGVIGFLNGLISAVVWGINGVIGMLNKLSFKVPGWVPGLGGQTFGFQIKTLTAPQIPYLAKGAVLPANKPFLAMVGDQKHGTNVEAPLSVIQEAVAGVMADQTDVLMAGFQASVSVQKEILEAVLGIHIGDSVIARAAQRYQQKMAIVQGGVR